MAPVSYWLHLLPQWVIHPTFHADLLTPYRKTTTHGENHLHPPPELINDEEEYKVEAISRLSKIWLRVQTTIPYQVAGVSKFQEPMGRRR